MLGVQPPEAYEADRIREADTESYVCFIFSRFTGRTEPYPASAEVDLNIRLCPEQEIDH